MSFLRFLMLLSLVVWVGGLIFFAFVLAPTVFAPGILPARQFAGNVVNRSLGILHWMGLTSGAVFLLCSWMESRWASGRVRPFALRNLLIYGMIVLTLIGTFGIARKMIVLRNEMGFIDNVPHDDPRRVEFNRLHVWSTRVEEGVLFLGLVLVFVTARRME